DRRRPREKSGKERMKTHTIFVLALLFVVIIVVVLRMRPPAPQVIVIPFDPPTYPLAPKREKEVADLNDKVELYETKLEERVRNLEKSASEAALRGDAATQARLNEQRAEIARDGEA